MRIGYSFVVCLVVTLVALTAAKTEQSSEVLNHRPMLRGQNPSPMTFNKQAPHAAPEHPIHMVEKNSHVNIAQGNRNFDRPMAHGPPNNIMHETERKAHSFAERKAHVAYLQPELNPIRTLEERGHLPRDQPTDGDGNQPRGPPPRRAPPSDGDNTGGPPDGTRPRGPPPRRAPPSDGDNTDVPQDGTRPRGPPPHGAPPAGGYNGRPDPEAHHAMMRGGGVVGASTAENQVPKLLESYRLDEVPAAVATAVETPELAAVSGLAAPNAASAVENKVPLIVPEGSMVAPQETAIFVPKDMLAVDATAAETRNPQAKGHPAVLPSTVPASVPVSSPAAAPSSYQSSSNHHRHYKTKRESAKEHAHEQEHVHSPKRHTSGHMDKQTGQYKSFKDNYGTTKTFKQ